MLELLFGVGVFNVYLGTWFMIQEIDGSRIVDYFLALAMVIFGLIAVIVSLYFGLRKQNGRKF